MIILFILCKYLRARVSTSQCEMLSLSGGATARNARALGRARKDPLSSKRRAEQIRNAAQMPGCGQGVVFKSTKRRARRGSLRKRRRGLSSGIFAGRSTFRRNARGTVPAQVVELGMAAGCLITFWPIDSPASPMATTRRSPMGQNHCEGSLPTMQPRSTGRDTASLMNAGCLSVVDITARHLSRYGGSSRTAD
jgi:hypothetical protein